MRNRAPRDEEKKKVTEGKMTSRQTPRRIFDADATQRRVYFSWKRALAMCMANVRNRRGRFLLTLVCVTVTVAFVTASMTHQSILAELARSTDVHTRAVLERAGAFTTDEAALKKQADQRTWILTLSIVLCVTGITNTMLMSVHERAREIGTLSASARSTSSSSACSCWRVCWWAGSAVRSGR